MIDLITQTIDQLGYLGVGLLMLVETLIPPIPSEVIMPLVGLAAANGDLTLAGATAAAIVGSSAGATAWYAAARAYGPEKLIRLADRHGKWLGLSSEMVRRPAAWFARRGGWTIFLARILPGMRVYISVPAGLTGMPLSRFMIFTVAGYSVWYGLLGVAGYALGANVPLIIDSLTTVAPYIWAALVAWVAWRLYRLWRGIKADDTGNTLPQ